jgi:hypothetical protein
MQIAFLAETVPCPFEILAETLADVHVRMETKMNKYTTVDNHVPSSKGSTTLFFSRNLREVTYSPPL